jgi:WD40 repeat protein
MTIFYIRLPLQAFHDTEGSPFLAAGNETGTITILDGESGAVLHRLDGLIGRVWSILAYLDPAGEMRLVGGDSDGGMKAWDPLSGVTVHERVSKCSCWICVVSWELAA